VNLIRAAIENGGKERLISIFKLNVLLIVGTEVEHLSTIFIKARTAFGLDLSPSAP
jgi:hypothetical protein